MIHSKRFWFGIAGFIALAAFASGCAMAVGNGESTEQSTEELQTVEQTPVLTVSPDSPTASTVSIPTVPLIAPRVHVDHLLSGSGIDEGPQPHPWTPPPETTTASDSTSSSGKK